MKQNFIARHNFGFTYLSDSSENQLTLHVLVFKLRLLLVSKFTLRNYCNPKALLCTINLLIIIIIIIMITIIIIVIIITIINV